MAGFIRFESPDNPWPVALALGIPALLLGCLLVLFPVGTLWILLSLAAVISLGLGLILLAIAGKMLLDGSPAFLVPLVPGTCALVFGAAALLEPGFILAFLGVLLGFACLAGGLVVAGTGISRRDSLARRIPAVAAGCLLAALGILVLLHPRGAAELSLRLAGLILAAMGALLLAGAILARPERDPLEDPEFRVIEEK